MSTPSVRIPSQPHPDKGVAHPAPQQVKGELLDRLLSHITLVQAPHDVQPLMAPYTGELIRNIPVGTEADVREAVKLARQAQKRWAATPVAERARILQRYHDLVLDRQDLLLDVIQLENGKARKHAFEEIADTAIVARHYAYRAEKLLKPRKRSGVLPLLTQTWEYHHPLGVVGFISPWNYPLSLSVTDALSALVAGNAVVLKPDQQTPFTALIAIDLLIEAGLPTGLFQVVTGRGREVGTAIIQQTDYICFTGSTDTGRIIGRQAGERLIGCSLELGGKNPMLVLEDADIEKASEGAVRACFTNMGQLCMSIERLYVHASLYDRFLQRFAERTRALKLGASYDFDQDMGCMINQGMLDKVQEHVEDARAKGATVVAGGRARPELGPLFYEPTILTGVTPEMALYQEETFGPVVSVYRFESLEEGIALANDSSYGLNASIWSENARRARDVAMRLECGTVNINEGFAAGYGSVDAPMGGFKDSGLGRRHGDYGLLKYTEVQTISEQRLLPLAAKGVSERTYARVISFLLKAMRHIPGLR